MLRTADALTLSRAVLALPVTVLALRGHTRTASLLFALGGLSDLLDGWLARRAGSTALGRQLDPLADKLLTDSALVALSLRHRVPWPLTTTLVTRDLLVTLLRAQDGTDHLPPSPSARVKTGLLYAGTTWLLRAPSDTLPPTLMLTTAVLLSSVSAWRYLTRR